MANSISLKQYQELPRNQVLKFKYDGQIVHIRPGFIGAFKPRMQDTILNEDSGIFFKINDFELYKKDPINTSILEYLHVDASKIDGEIEIIDLG